MFKLDQNLDFSVFSVEILLLLKVFLNFLIKMYLKYKEMYKMYLFFNIVQGSLWKLVKSRLAQEKH